MNQHQPRVQNKLPRSRRSRGIERVWKLGDIYNPRTRRPRHRHRAGRRLRNFENIIRPAAAQQVGRHTVHQQIGRIHSADRLAERDTDLRQVRQGRPCHWAPRHDRRRDLVDKIIFPPRVLAQVVKRQIRRPAKIVNTAAGGDRHFHFAKSRLGERKDVVGAAPAHTGGRNAVDEQVARIDPLHPFTAAHRDIGQHVGHVREKRRNDRHDVGRLGICRRNRDDDAGHDRSALQAIRAKRYRLQRVAAEGSIPHRAIGTAVVRTNRHSIDEEKHVRHATIQRAGVGRDQHVGWPFHHRPVGRPSDLRKGSVYLVIERDHHWRRTLTGPLIIGAHCFE